jgi:predicted peptidase
MGGYGAWELAMRAPNRFTAVVPICGGGDQRRAAKLGNVPLWAVHGANDNVIPVSESQVMIAALESAGGKPRYLELPGVGHDCWTYVFRENSEVLAWMFRERFPSYGFPVDTATRNDR